MFSRIMMHASRFSAKQINSTMAPSFWKTLTLYQCLCAVLLVQVSVLELTSQLGCASLAELVTDNPANNLISRRVDKVDLDQLHEIDDDSVMEFLGAQKRSLSANSIAASNVEADGVADDDDDADADADADADDSFKVQENEISEVDDKKEQAPANGGYGGVFARIAQAARNTVAMVRCASAPNFFARVSQAAGDAIAPARSYFNVIRRFKNWRNAYNKLQEEFGKRSGSDDVYVLANSSDVIRFEYAKLDNDMMSEICHRNIGSSSGTTATTTSTDSAHVVESKSENMDFMWNLLNRLIERLEQKLEELRAKGPEGVLADEKALLEDPEAEQRMKLEGERQVHVATDRAKRIAAHSLSNFAAKEFMHGLSLYTFNALATFVSNNAGGPADPGIMSTIEPIILLLGNANTPLMVSYLRNIQFRATLNIVSYSLSKLSCPLRVKTPAVVTDNTTDSTTETTTVRAFEVN